MSAPVTRRVSGAREALMPIVVIALGVIMVLSGAYEIYFGNTYISVERGWSAFISGTVLFTGGLVTIVLGLAIRAITDLKTALLDRGPAIPASHVEPAFSHTEFPQPDFAAPTREEIAPHAVPASAALAAALAPDLAPDLPPIGGRVEMPSEAPVHHHEPDAGHPDERAHDAETHGSDRGADLMAPALAAEAERLEPVRSQADRRSAAEAPPSDDDWLDRSFDDLGREFGPASEPPPRLHDDPKHQSLEDPAIEDAVFAEHVADHHEAHEPDAHVPDIRETVDVPHVHDHTAEAVHDHTDEAPTAPTAAVIGRYEAEGTSYVMYADGSIEAQSEAGVYRFASMAELKSFIEG